MIYMKSTTLLDVYGSSCKIKVAAPALSDARERQRYQQRKVRHFRSTNIR